MKTIWQHFEDYIFKTACGGGQCEFDQGQWFICQLHWRELCEVTEQ